MNSTAFTLFGLDVQWYGLLIAISVLLGAALGLREAKRKGIEEDTILDLLIWAIPLAIIGARLYYVIFSWDFYKNNPIEILNIRKGGMAIHGVIITAIIVVYIFSKVRQENFWTILDIASPSLILGQAIGRWGNYINQEAYGRPTDLPWGIMIDGVKVHPTFLYESIWNILVFLFLLYFRRKKAIVEGEVFLLYLISYSFIRFFIEGLRTDSLMWGPIRVAQLISIVAIVFGLYFFLHRRKKANDL